MLQMVRELVVAHRATAIAVAAALGLAAVAYLVGRFTAPVRVETRTVDRVVYQDRVVTRTVQIQAQAEARAETKTRVVVRDRYVYPDGTKRDHEVSTSGDQTQTRRTVQEVVGANTERTVQTVQEHAATKTVESPRPSWHVSVLAAVRPLHLLEPELLGPVAFGGHVERRLLGPVFAGVFVLSSGSAGVSLGADF